MTHSARLQRLQSAAPSIPIQDTFIILVLALHVPLAYVMHASGIVATVHALTVLTLGIWFIIRDDQPFRLIYLTGYIAGAGVLWRMTHASIFWEFGKYAICLLLILAIIKWKDRFKILPVAYFLMLLPSVILTVSNAPAGQVRGDISFTLSGPLTLAIAVFFFSGKKLDRRQVQQLFFYTIMPIVSIAFLAFFHLDSAKIIAFGTHSSVLGSGGFGPNQVSGILGLGALLCWLLILSQTKISKMTWVSCGLLFWFFTQAILTFSRGGVLNFLVAGVFSTPFLLKKRPDLINKFLISAAVIGIVVFLVLPKLDQFTQGAMQARFSETSTTGRWDLIKHDLALWQKNFILGVGPGLSQTTFRQTTGSSLIERSNAVGEVAHTEYSRLVAEHGLFGAVALILLLIMFVTAFTRAPSAWAKGLALACTLWSMTAMVHMDMRVAAISFLFGLGFAEFEDH